MKIAYCVSGGRRFWALVDLGAQTVRPMSGAVADWAPKFIESFDPKSLSLGSALPLADVELLPPIERGNKVVVAGANYTRHLKEFGLASPPNPFAFLKASNALIGHSDPIRYPERTEQLDYEVELVAVVGAAHIDRERPFASVLGYTVGNDVSARDLQRSGPKGIGMDLYAAKSQYRTTGLGPWIVTRDEFPEGQPDLRMTLKVNGEVRQNGSSVEMTWDIGHLMAFIDANVRFETGDILFTGTPEGIAQTSGRYLQPGDVVEAEIQRLGKLRNVVERQL
jgi:2-keto-4-pentenoate hydratase/2-oxohepta-3-ene-1,7-dioic acid hydratase in catechol pathway